MLLKSQNRRRSEVFIGAAFAPALGPPSLAAMWRRSGASHSARSGRGCAGEAVIQRRETRPQSLASKPHFAVVGLRRLTCLGSPLTCEPFHKVREPQMLLTIHLSCSGPERIVQVPRKTNHPSRSLGLIARVSLQFHSTSPHTHDGIGRQQWLACCSELLFGFDSGWWRLKLPQDQQVGRADLQVREVPNFHNRAR